MVIYYAQETDNNIACNLKLLDPRDYGGQSTGWDDGYTNLVIHSGESEKATLFLVLASGEVSELEASARFPRNIYPFQGQEAFTLEWTRIDETEIVVVQPEVKETWQVFKIGKLSYLQTLEVVPYAYNFGFGGFLDFTNPRLDIPRNCLNIYLRSTQPSIISGILGGSDNPTFIDETRFVTQFCTNNPGILEPPKYFVLIIQEF